MRWLTISTLLIQLACGLLACTSTKITYSVPKRFYFAKTDTIVAGAYSPPKRFQPTAEEMLFKGFQNCKATILSLQNLEDLAHRKAVLFDYSLRNPHLDAANRTKLKGYFITASLIDSNEEASGIRFSPKDINKVNPAEHYPPEPFVTFAFHVIDIPSGLVLLNTKVTVRKSSVPVGSSGNDYISVNDGISANWPSVPFKRALNKFLKRCHCK